MDYDLVDNNDNQHDVYDSHYIIMQWARSLKQKGVSVEHFPFVYYEVGEVMYYVLMGGPTRRRATGPGTTVQGSWTASY